MLSITVMGKKGVLLKDSVKFLGKESVATACGGRKYETSAKETVNPVDETAAQAV